MAQSRSGYVSHPTLDGIELSGISPHDFQEIPRASEETVELATNNLRKSINYTGASMPDLKTLYDWRANYERLAKHGDNSWLRILECAKSRPGVHTFTTWRHRFVSWTSIGGGVEFLFPWQIAPYVLSLPSSDPSGIAKAPWISTDYTDAVGLSIVEKTAAQYDAGSAGVGEAWVDTEGQRFKINAVLAAGTPIYASIVPLHVVYIEDSDARKLKVGREGRMLTFREVSW